MNTKKFEEFKSNCDFDTIKHMVAVGTLDLETFYAVVRFRLATGLLKDAPRY